MLDPHLDFRAVQGKVGAALERKLAGMSPCKNEEWRAFLKEFGIQAQVSEYEKYRGGFMRVADPMVQYVINANGAAVATRRGILYVPDEVIEKILVLGALP